MKKHIREYLQERMPNPALKPGVVLNPKGTNRYTSKKAQRKEKLREVLYEMLEDYRTYYQRTGKRRPVTALELNAVRYLFALEEISISNYTYNTRSPKDGNKRVEEIKQELDAEFGIPKELLEPEETNGNE